MKTTTTETHERKCFAYVDRRELEGIVARAVAAEAGIDLTADGVSVKVAFEDATEGSPSYRVGQTAKVTITTCLEGDGS